MGKRRRNQKKTKTKNRQQKPQLQITPGLEVIQPKISPNMFVIFLMLFKPKIALKIKEPLKNGAENSTNLRIIITNISICIATLAGLLLSVLSLFYPNLFPKTSLILLLLEKLKQ